MTALRYRAVLFDLDGTLVDSYAALADAVNFALRAHGLREIDTGRIRTLVGHGIERLLQRACETDNVPRSVSEAFETRYDEVCCTASKILDDVEPTLARLTAAGVTMAVCTNKPTSFSRKILDFLNLSPHFRAIVGPDLAGARKPDARHVIRTLEEAGCSPDGSLFVGDMPIDVAAARNSGIDVAVVTTGSSSYEQLLESHPDYLLDRFSDLLGIVRKGASA
ncbi:MAG TPA: HAD hydrolase-like protein [Thermoanaerobaculia bacterium]|nr:HAD hydrolase-like protein [Thermoanaerobaculia bacterium]